MEIRGIIGIIFMIIGTPLTAIGIANLLKIAFGRGCGVGILCLIFPILFLGFLGDEEGLKAWGQFSLGLVLSFFGVLMTM